MARNGYEFGSYRNTANRYEGSSLCSGFLLWVRQFEWSSHHLMPKVRGSAFNLSLSHKQQLDVRHKDKENQAMKRTCYLFILLLVFLISILSIACADPVVREIYYQKKTTLAPSKTYTLRFSLWDAETLGNEVWSEEKPVQVEKTTIKTYLGSDVLLDPQIFCSSSGFKWRERQRRAMWP